MSTDEPNPGFRIDHPCFHTPPDTTPPPEGPMQFKFIPV